MLVDEAKSDEHLFEFLMLDVTLLYAQYLPLNTYSNSAVLVSK